MKIWFRIIYANLAATASNIVVTVLIPAGLYRLSEYGFLTVLIGCAVCAWTVTFFASKRLMEL